MCLSVSALLTGLAHRDVDNPYNNLVHTGITTRRVEGKPLS